MLAVIASSMVHCLLRPMHVQLPIMSKKRCQGVQWTDQIRNGLCLKEISMDLSFISTMRLL